MDEQHYLRSPTDLRGPGRGQERDQHTAGKREERHRVEGPEKWKLCKTRNLEVVAITWRIMTMKDM